MAHQIDTSPDYYSRMKAAGDVVAAIFKENVGDMARVKAAMKEIVKLQAPAIATEYDAQAKLIPKGQYWSSNQQRAVSRETVLNWCTATYDKPEGDRFWASGNKGFIGIAKVPTSTGMAWMMTLFVGNDCVGSNQTDSAFDLMLHFDGWTEELRAQAD